MKRAIFTTSKDPNNPDYYFLARKIKFVPGEKIVTGLVNMYIADVPTPIGLPFAYFPMTTDRKSGVIIPSFGNNNNQGYFLQNGGYYFAINDYVDLTVLGDYFTMVVGVLESRVAIENGMHLMVVSVFYMKIKFKVNEAFLISSKPIVITSTGNTVRTQKVILIAVSALV